MKITASKMTHKLTPAIIKVIVELSVMGETSGKIAQAVKREFSIEVTEQAIRYHRLKKKATIARQREKEIVRAMALFPVATLEGRIAVLQEAIDKEEGKKKRSNSRIGYLVDIADRCMKNARELELRERELEFKMAKARKGEDYGDKIIDFEEVRRKIVVGRLDAAKNDELAKLAGWEDE